MKPIQPIFLLDLDHVLVQPNGYREGVRATLAYFTQRMGLTEIWPGQDVMAHLEAINMTCEWDQAAILLANLLETLAADRPELTLPDTLEETLSFVRDNGYAAPPQNLFSLIARLGEQFTPGQEYARLALELSQAGKADPLFPHLAGSQLLEQLLGDVRSLTGSFSTSVFQNFILGGDRFEAVYGLPRYFDGEAYLSLYDGVLLDKKSCTLLTTLWLTGKVGMAVFTARPSVPDFNHPVALHYSAEAELALELLGLTDLPLVGAGQMCWLAEGLGCADYKVLKPSPVQTLAAIGAANGMDVRAALTAAGELVFQGRTQGFSDLPPLSIHVFEDSGGNVRSVYEAARLLKTLGIQTEVSAWGIADDPVKQQALTAAGATVLLDTRTAIQAALQQEELA